MQCCCWSYNTLFPLQLGLADVIVEFDLYSSFTVVFFFNWIIPGPVLFQTKQAKKGNLSKGSFTVSRAENLCA